MKNKSMCKWLMPVVCLSLASVSASSAEPAEQQGAPRPVKPNIVLLLTDDLGWQDVKCYDIDEPSPMETPNIDALAKKGVMFWQAYSPAPVCAPSRCAIMSGNHPARAQKTNVVGGAPPVPIHKGHSRVMNPWFSGRMPANEQTLARVLQENGYTTGHSGKWHMAIDHLAFPQPEDQGFDYTRKSRGNRGSMNDRLKDFATSAPGVQFRLDENGFPYHQTNEDALTFLRESKDKPFFLYYATWLVHAPILTHSKAHLDKYAKKLGVDPSKVSKQDTPGQINPFYCAMVEELDYYVGLMFNYLDTTEDPRWPGHMLSENTYLIFTSDNGGMEGDSKERCTDNRPLDRGKISAKEGGTRVPLIIRGPGIPAGVQTDVMANGLDFYPTILSMTGITKPKGKNLDGCDLMPLLTKNPKDADLVKELDGATRGTVMHHFPHGYAMESTLRIGDYKLIRNYDHLSNPKVEPFELYQLYDSAEGGPKRVDIGESKNLAKSMPEKVKSMDAELSQILTEMKADLPSYNPKTKSDLPYKNLVPKVLEHKQDGDAVTFTLKENGAKVVRAELIYSQNGEDRYEEWFKVEAKLEGGIKAHVQLPKGTTHYLINLIDEHNFLVSYPEMEDYRERSKSKAKYSVSAIKVN